MDESFDLELRQRFPKEAAMWQAIRHMLKPKSFMEFHMYLGECPESHELRPRRDGKRAPFEMDHFEWVPRGTPKRADSALKTANEVGGLQSQIDALRAQIADLRADLTVLAGVQQPLFAPAAVKDGHFCVIDTGRSIGRYQIETEAEAKPGFVSVHPTEEAAMAKVQELINGGEA